MITGFFLNFAIFFVGFTTPSQGFFYFFFSVPNELYRKQSLLLLTAVWQKLPENLGRIFKFTLGSLRQAAKR